MTVTVILGCWKGELNDLTEINMEWLRGDDGGLNTTIISIFWAIRGRNLARFRTNHLEKLTVAVVALWSASLALLTVAVARVHARILLGFILAVWPLRFEVQPLPRDNFRSFQRLH